MKRLTILAIALCLILLPSLALGAQSPLEEVSRNRVVYSKGNTVKLVSYYATLTVRGSTSVNATLTLKNRSDEAVEFYIGTPSPMDSGYQVDNPQAWCEGQSLPLKQIKKDSAASEGMPEDWYGWRLAFAPKQVRELIISFSTDTKIEPDGTRCVIYPLHYLRNFAEETDYVQVVADMDYAPPYIYNPTPSPTPRQVESGSLTWSYAGADYPDQIVLKFKPIIPVIERYLQDKAGGDSDIGLILSVFDLGQYQETIDLIDTHIADHDDYKNALLTLKSICLQKMMRLDEALDLNNLLLSDPGFGDMNPVFQNRIIYENAWIMGAREEEQSEILEYLAAQQETVDEDSLFGQWLGQEIWTLSPRPTPAPEPTPQPAAAPAEEEKTSGGRWFESIMEKTVTIVSLKIPLLYLIGGGLLVIIILVIIIVRRKGRGRRTHYYYR